MRAANAYLEFHPRKRIDVEVRDIPAWMRIASKMNRWGHWMESDSTEVFSDSKTHSMCCLYKAATLSNPQISLSELSNSIGTKNRYYF